VSSVPAEIAGLGSSAMKLRVSPGFDPLKAQVGPDEYFVLSRIDGTQTIREVLLSTGLPVERGIAIVTRLRSIGALLLPGEASAPVPAVAAPALPRAKATTPRTPATPPHGVAVTGDIARAPTISVTPEMPAVSRTQTPHTPMTGRTPSRPGSEVGAVRPGSRSGTGSERFGSQPSAPRPGSQPGVPLTAPPTGSGPAVARTQTPRAPMQPLRTPARLSPPTPSDVDPPTVPRALVEPPTTPRTQLGAHPHPVRPPAPVELDAPTVRRAPSADLSVVLPNPTPEEREALAEPCDLPPDERVRILAMARLAAGRDPWALLGVPSGADAKVLKRAYFKLSKEVHPDRYYGRQLGSFADRLNVIFEAVSRAYAKLTSPDKHRRSGAHQAVVADKPQTPAEYAAELFERACALEVSGDALDAMKLFAAAVRIDPQTRYLRRAASCALAAEQPKTALEYAKKAQAQAPNDPSAARLLASAFKATGRYADAEEVLVMAMALKNENDVLTAELRNDLAEVRRLISG
jgi:hypothetical protein